MAKPSGGANRADRKALDDLGARIESARNKASPKRDVKPSKYSSLTIAWQMVLELVVGTSIGASIGYALDWAMGTLPLMLVICGGLGFVAGIKMVLASSHSIGKRAAAAAEGDDLGGESG